MPTRARRRASWALGAVAAALVAGGLVDPCDHRRPERAPVEDHWSPGERDGIGRARQR